MTLIPRTLLYPALAAIVALAILFATAQAALVYRAPGPVIAALLGVALLPMLVRGASSGVLRAPAAWAAAITGSVICFTATIGLDPARMDCVSVSWLTCGVLAGAVMVWMTGHRAPPLCAVTCLLIRVLMWAGPMGTIRLGLAAELVIIVAALIIHRSLLEVTDAIRAAAHEEQELAVRKAEEDAFRLERQQRLQSAARNVVPMLQSIIERGGQLDDASRKVCARLEQTLRDEIRGRRLLNDSVRSVVLAHRQRGASVQVLDDGGLDDLAPLALNGLLNDLAHRLAPVRSSRIVIRTGQPDSPTAISIVASTPDETAVALGLDDETVDLWDLIPRPTP